MATLASAEDMGALFQQIGDLEKSFADAELKARKLAFPRAPQCDS